MHKVYVFTVVAGMYEGVCAEKMQRKKRRGNICALQLSVGMSLNRQGGSFGMHMRVVKGGGSWALVCRVFGGPGSLRS